eukprot:477372-Prymnesium_polylepis.2
MNFWVPSATPQAASRVDKPDTTVRCPITNEPLRLKQLFVVKFTTAQEGASSADLVGMSAKERYICPLTKKPLSSAPHRLATSGRASTHVLMMMMMMTMTGGKAGLGKRHPRSTRDRLRPAQETRAAPTRPPCVALLRRYLPGDSAATERHGRVQHVRQGHHQEGALPRKRPPRLLRDADSLIR